MGLWVYGRWIEFADMVNGSRFNGSMVQWFKVQGDALSLPRRCAELVEACSKYDLLCTPHTSLSLQTMGRKGNKINNSNQMPTKESHFYSRIQYYRLLPSDNSLFANIREKAEADVLHCQSEISDY